MKTANILTLLFLRYRILLFLLKTEKSPSTFAELWATNLESEFPRREKKEGKWKRKRKTWNQNPSIFQCNENFEQQIQQCMTQKPNRLHLCVLVLLCYVIDFWNWKRLIIYSHQSIASQERGTLICYYLVDTTSINQSLLFGSFPVQNQWLRDTSL